MFTIFKMFKYLINYILLFIGTVPEGDIFVKYGDNLQIWCNLNETLVAKEYPGSNSSNIYFIRDNTTVDQKFITTINKTTALLTIESPPAGWYTYSCDLDIPGDKDAAVCLNIVFVACKQSYSLVNLSYIFELHISFTFQKIFFSLIILSIRNIFYLFYFYKRKYILYDIRLIQII